MAQTKKQKQEKVLIRLIAEYEKEKEERIKIQDRNGYILFPSYKESRLLHEINNLKRAIGQD